MASVRRCGARMRAEEEMGGGVSERKKQTGPRPVRARGGRIFREGAAVRVPVVVRLVGRWMIVGVISPRIESGGTWVLSRGLEFLRADGIEC